MRWEAADSSVQFSSLSHVCLFATPWTAAHQASLSITNSWSLLKLTDGGQGLPSSCLSKGYAAEAWTGDVLCPGSPAWIRSGSGWVTPSACCPTFLSCNVGIILHAWSCHEGGWMRGSALHTWGSFSPPGTAWLLGGSVTYHLSRSEVMTPALN